MWVCATDGTHGTYGTNVLARLDMLPMATGVSSGSAQIGDEDEYEPFPQTANSKPPTANR